MIVAIDGTLASGKGTIARQVARKYGLAHMDTGRLYRATGVAALRSDTALTDAKALAGLAETLDLDQFDEADLRTAEAGQAASKVAAIPEVRAALVALQRSFANREGGAVLDGRDIGTVICPDADIKLWIDANIAERARRRAAELAAAGKPISQEDMLAELQERDNRDRTRASAPMQMAKEAVLIDTTDLGIDAAVEKAFAAIDAVIANRNSAL
ncbi:MAG: (d)CMP kinase [Hyphomonadaceae bacterium]